MALLPEYHVVADGVLPVDPNTNPSIVEGHFVMMNSTGFVVKATGAAGTTAIGVAGDSTAASTDTTANTPYESDLVVSSNGFKVTTANRVSDPNFNESAATGKVTVYMSGGRFSTDEYETLNGGSPITYGYGNSLYVSANGKLTNIASANSQVVAICLVPPRAYPSGVPGTDTADGSISLGTYITYKLVL